MTRSFLSFWLACTLTPILACNDTSSVTGTATSGDGDSGTSGGEATTAPATTATSTDSNASDTESSQESSSSSSESSSGEASSSGTAPDSSSSSGEPELLCGCDSVRSTCTDVPVVCELSVFCPTGIGLTTLECMQEAELDQAQVDALDCVLSFLDDPSRGRAIVGVSGDGGFVFSSRTLHVDGVEQTMIGFDGIDVEGSYFAMSGGDHATAASPCAALDDANERLVCAYDAFAVGDPIDCE